MLYGIIISLITLIAILLIVVVLLQPGQKEGLTGGLAAGMAGGAAMGARRTADLLSKTTTILATLFLALSVLANFAIDRGGSGQSTIQQQGVPGLQQEQPGEMNDFTAPSQSQPAIPQQDDPDEEN
ncbi:preprotein translocase subunit SecG [Rhodohalobacter sp. SW132]|uniref:preprotein translocase subunit SecG n=1 Tax=Rhodohalobacter sp. SW132 TaxID=2293433 RepID=UPI000E221C91|nr:preprotein translocase subunit SecG [Rhodohalobacter sp. SW132]REL38879.1 preprotein translocase subunit SecG [Rhodohalobacter sp. SW132]